MGGLDIRTDFRRIEPTMFPELATATQGKRRGLVGHLMRTRGYGYEKALSTAKAIEAGRKEAVAKKKARLERAQLTLGLGEEQPGEEPASRFEVTDLTVDF